MICLGHGPTIAMRPLALDHEIVERRRCRSGDQIAKQLGGKESEGAIAVIAIRSKTLFAPLTGPISGRPSRLVSNCRPSGIPLPGRPGGQSAASFSECKDDFCPIRRSRSSGWITSSQSSPPAEVVTAKKRPRFAGARSSMCSACSRCARCRGKNLVRAMITGWKRRHRGAFPAGTF
jgi:hypothetical protein